MSETEVLAVVRFALIAAVILPLLPDRAFGPFDAWHPRKLWLVGSALAALFFLWPARKAQPAQANTLSVRNPFDIGPALLLMALVMLATLASRYVLDSYGDAGLATVLALTGIVDVDSAIIAMGNMPAGSLSPHIAALVLLLAVLLNTLLKALAAISIAGWKRAWPASAALVASGLACLCALPWVL